MPSLYLPQVFFEVLDFLFQKGHGFLQFFLVAFGDHVLAGEPLVLVGERFVVGLQLRVVAVAVGQLLDTLVQLLLQRDDARLLKPDRICRMLIDIRTGTGTRRTTIPTLIKESKSTLQRLHLVRAGDRVDQLGFCRDLRLEIRHQRRGRLLHRLQRLRGDQPELLRLPLRSSLRA